MINQDAIRNVLGDRFDYKDPLWLQLKKCAQAQKNEIVWSYLERDAVLEKPEDLKASVIDLAQAFLRGEAPLFFDPESCVKLIKAYQEHFNQKSKDNPSSILSLRENWLPEELDFLEMSECWGPEDRTNLFSRPAENPFLPFLEELNAVSGAVKVARYYQEREPEENSGSASERVPGIFWRYRAICSCLNDIVSSQAAHSNQAEKNRSVFAASHNPYSCAAVDNLFSSPVNYETVVQDIDLFEYVISYSNSDQLESLRLAYMVVLQKHAPYLGITPSFLNASLAQIVSAFCTSKPEKINDFIVTNRIPVDWNAFTANDWMLLIDEYGPLFDKVFAPFFSDKTSDPNYFKQVCKVLTTPIKNFTIGKNPTDEYIHLSLDWPELLIDTQYLKDIDTRFGVLIYLSKSSSLENVKNPFEVAHSTFKRLDRAILIGGPKTVSEYYFGIKWHFSFGGNWNAKPLHSKMNRCHYVPEDNLIQIRWDLDFSKKGQELFITSCPEPTSFDLTKSFVFSILSPNGNASQQDPVGALPALTLVKKLSTMPESISDGEVIVVMEGQNSPRAWVPVDPCHQEEDAKYRLFISKEEDKQEYHIASRKKNIRQKRYRSKQLKCPYCLKHLSLFDKLTCQYQCERCAEKLKSRRALKDSDEDPRSFSPIITPTPSWKTRLFRGEIRCLKPDCKDGSIVKPLCPHCGMPLPVDIWDYDATVSIGLIGLPGSGKTNYCDALVSSLGTMGLAPATSDEIKALSELAKLAAEYKLAPKTAPVSDLSQYLGLFRVPVKGKQILIDLIDFAGEEFREDKAGSGLDLHNKIKVLTKADGLIAMIDPMQFQTVRRSIKKNREDIPQGVGGTDQASTMFQFVINWIRQGFVKDKRRIIPLAVTLSKIDLLKVEDARTLSPEDYAMFHKGAALFDRNTPVDDIDLIIRNLISSLDPTLKSIVEKRFKALKFFGVSSLGMAPNKENVLRKKINPFRVIEPFLWLLACNNVILTGNDGGHR